MVLSIIIVIAVVLFIALIINLVEDAHKEKDNTFTYMSFKEALDLVELPIVTFINNGNKVNFLLDTGSNLSYINVTELDRLKFQKNDLNTSILTASGSQEGLGSIICKFNYKDMEFEDHLFVNDMSESFNTIKQESGVSIHGILGSNFFTKYQYVFDYESFVAYSKNTKTK